MAGQLCVLGAGSWGTALTIALAKQFDEVRLWSHSADKTAAIQRLRTNNEYLAGFDLPSNVSVTADSQHALKGRDVMLCAVPSHAVRETMDHISPHLPKTADVVSATKGLEQGTLKTMSEVIAECLQFGDARDVAVLSGPTFAKEVAAGEPAAVVIASRRLELAVSVQKSFSTNSLRLYTSTDVRGVELGAALKNVIAIGAGICRGLGLGSNSVAALVTRGLAEITRLAVAMGGNHRTLSGLAGLGDLVLTATGDLSRNRHVGIELGSGQKLGDILKAMHMVAEGVDTCQAAFHLSVRYQIEMPIVQQMYSVLYEEKPPQTAIAELMERPLTAE